MSSDQGDERHGINREIRVRKPRSPYPTPSFPFQVSGPPEVYFATTSTSKKWVNKKSSFSIGEREERLTGSGRAARSRSGAKRARLFHPLALHFKTLDIQLVRKRRREGESGEGAARERGKSEAKAKGGRNLLGWREGREWKVGQIRRR